MQQARPATSAARHYDLFLREDRKRFFLRYKDRGVTLDGSAITWMTDGGEKRQPYENIYSVRLQSATINNSPAIFTCIIQFRDGQRLLVTSASEYGSGWDEQSKLYGKFLRDFHASIPKGERDRILFCAGNTEGRQKFLWATLVVAGLFFIGMPVALLLITGDMKALGITLAGVALVYPLVRSAMTNQPRNYRCEYLPDELVPI